MIISYYIQTESGDSYLELGEYTSAQNFKEDLMSNIESYYPVAFSNVRTLNTTKEQDKEVKEVMKEFYDYSWVYGE